MRSLFTPLILLVFLSRVGAQNCGGYYVFNKADIEMMTYDDKGKEDGKLTYSVSDITKVSDEFIASLVSESKNKMGTSLSKVAGKYKCNNSSLFIDAAVAIPKEQMAPYKDMDVQSGLSFVEYPSKLVTNQAFRDTSFTVQVLNGGTLYTTLTLNQKNRKVMSKETLVNRTGTWECWKITYDGTLTSNNGTSTPTVYNYKSSEWFAPGFGLVKSETYSTANVLISSFGISSAKRW